MMCSTSVHIAPTQARPALTVHAMNRFDPTRTLTLRNRFVSDLNKRFRELRGEIRRAIVDQDVFGLSGTNGSPTTNGIGLTTNVQRRAFSFPRSQDKVSSFMEWLESQVNSTILEVRQREQIGQAIDQAWTNIYIEDTYKRGVQRARYEMKRGGYDVPSVAESGGLQAVMDIPMHADRLGLLYTRTFNELRGVTDAMDQQISRVLAQGIADGDNPMLLARKLNATISGKGIGELGLTDILGRYIPAERRARLIARTEVIRAHHQASIQEYRNWQVEGVRVQAEWRTAGDERVCEECGDLQGEVFTLQEIENMIPLHPQCRCFALPVPADRQTTPQAQQDLDDVANGLHDEYVDEYMGYRREYDAWFDEQGWDADVLQRLANFTADDIDPTRLDAFKPILDTLREKLKLDAGEVIDAQLMWQGATSNIHSLRLKWIAQQVERSASPNMRFPGFWSSKHTIEVLRQVREYTDLTISDYLRVRAFNQSFMAKARIRVERQYRGVNGPEGVEIAAHLNREGMRRTTFSIDEAPLSGWTTDTYTANKFGIREGGVTVAADLPAYEIFVHRALLNSMTKGAFFNELESIVLSYKRTFKIENINWIR